MPEAPFGDPPDDGTPKAAQPPVVIDGAAIARLPAVSPLDMLRPRSATEDLRIPEQVRPSWALDDLD